MLLKILIEKTFADCTVDGAGYYYNSSAFYLYVTSGRTFDSATTYTCLAG